MTTVIVVSSYKDPERFKYSNQIMFASESDHVEKLVIRNKPTQFFPVEKLDLKGPHLALDKPSYFSIMEKSST